MKYASAIVCCLFIFLSCQVPHYQRTPNGGWIENGQETYPAYQSIRTKKDILLPLSLRQNIENYYRKHHFFPVSTEGFLQEFPNSGLQIQQLYREGFENIAFIPMHRDTLAVAFAFKKQGKIYYDTHASIPFGKTETGRFLFAANPDGFIYYKRQIDKGRKKD